MIIGRMEVEIDDNRLSSMIISSDDHNQFNDDKHRLSRSIYDYRWVIDDQRWFLKIFQTHMPLLLVVFLLSVGYISSTRLFWER